MALASPYYDVLNQIVIDAQRCPSDTAERARIAAQVDERLVGRKHPYKINFAQALSCVKNQIIHVLREVTILSRIRVLLERCAQNIEAYRPDRRFMRRVSNLHQNLFFIAYKACR